MTIDFSGVSKLTYRLTLVFSMKTHISIYQLREREETNLDTLESEKHKTGLCKSVEILFVCTIVLVFISDTLVASLQEAISTLGLTSLFTGVILIPIFGGAVEYITAATLAIKNKMDLAVAMAMESSLQIAMFFAPVLVLTGQLMGQPMNLDFNPFEVLAVAANIIG